MRRHRLKAAAFLAPFLAASVAHARPCAPVAFGPPQRSLESAAASTLHNLLRAGHRWESGGFVIEHAGAFRSSKPVTQRSRTDVNYCIVLPRGARLAALYHTHVSKPEFSPRDLRNAERAGVPSFIATVLDGGLFVYDPEAGAVRRLGARPAPRAPVPISTVPATVHAADTWSAWLDAGLKSAATLARRLRDWFDD